MHSQRISVLLGLVFLIATWSWADKVTADYDHDINFYKYKTYMWIREPDTDEPFMKERIMAAVNAQLRIKGLRAVSDGADLAIGAGFVTEEKRAWETYYSDSGGWGWGGSGWSTTTEKIYQVGTLTVDLFDAQTKKLIWQGVVVDTVSRKPEKRTRDNDKGIEKMFKYFPPPSQG